MELIEGSETSAISFVMPGNYPKENILQTHGDLWPSDLKDKGASTTLTPCNLAGFLGDMACDVQKGDLVYCAVLWTIIHLF